MIAFLLRIRYLLTQKFMNIVDGRYYPDGNIGKGIDTAFNFRLLHVEDRLYNVINTQTQRFVTDEMARDIWGLVQRVLGGKRMPAMTTQALVEITRGSVP